MALSSLDKIRQIRKGMGNPALGEVTEQDIAVYLLAAMIQLASIHEFESLKTYEDVTMDGSTDYTLVATNVLKLLPPANNLASNSFPMKQTNLRWDQQIGVQIGSGTPYFVVPVSLASGVCIVRFRPIGSSGDIRVHYLKIPTAPGYTAGSENYTDLPEAYDLTEVSTAVQIGLGLTDQRDESGKEAQIGSGYHRAASTTLPQNYKHYYLQTAAHRLLGRKGKKI